MKHYRFETRENEISISIATLVFDVVKETPKGYWIAQHRHAKPRWVSKNTRKRYAYPTKEEALVNYQRRTKRHIMYSKNAVRRSEQGLLIAEAQKTKLTENHDTTRMV